MTHKSTIKIDVLMDENRVPEQISWNASDSTANMDQLAKAMLLAFWDGSDKSALRIDLWTKEMMVDEMADFYYQTLMTMADTFERATKNQEITADMKEFARTMMKKFKADQLKHNH
jgi:gliding motility-associated protein GldC